MTQFEYHSIKLVQCGMKLCKLLLNALNSNHFAKFRLSARTVTMVRSDTTTHPRLFVIYRMLKEKKAPANAPKHKKV